MRPALDVFHDHPGLGEVIARIAREADLGCRMSDGAEVPLHQGLASGRVEVGHDPSNTIPSQPVGTSSDAHSPHLGREPTRHAHGRNRPPHTVVPGVTSNRREKLIDVVPRRPVHPRHHGHQRRDTLEVSISGSSCPSGLMDRRWSVAPLKIAHSNLGQELVASLSGLVAAAAVAPEVPERLSAGQRRSGRRVAAEVEAAVVRGYRAGETIDGLAERLGVHRTTVMAVLDRRKVRRRRQGQVMSAA